MTIPRSFALAASLAVLTFSLPSGVLAAPAADPGIRASIDDLRAASSGRARVTVDDATGTARFIGFPQGLASFRLNGGTAAAGAIDFFQAHGAAFGIQDPASELSLKATRADALGFTHVTHTQLHEGIAVFAAELRTHFDKDGNLSAVNGVFIPAIKAGATPGLTAAKAASIAIAEVAGQQKHRLAVNQVGSQLEALKNTLTYYHTGIIRGIPGETVLVYEIEVGNRADVREFVFVDALKGEIVEQFTGIHAGAGADREVSETSLANIVWDESNGDPDPIPASWAGGTAQQVTDWNNEIDGARETYNVIDNLAGYFSYDDAEAAMRTVNNDPGISCPNANWNGISTNYCTGVTGDDTVAHEWGHAYTEYTHNLVYAWQPGALNESYSDIWGEVVDLVNGRGSDDAAGALRTTGSCSIHGTGTPANDSIYRWLSGEDDPAFGGAIRDMWRPVCYGDPGKVSDTQYHCAESDGGGVHTNSGVPNHAFALLVDGGTYNDQSITGIGLDKAAYIYWRAQAEYQGQATDFADHATAIAQSCTDLVGASLKALSATGTQGAAIASITAADCAELDKVIQAVEFNTPPTQCGFTPAFAAAPALCAGQGNGTVSSLASQDWESGTGGWSVGTHDIANAASFTNPDWVIRNSLPDGRSGSAMYVEDSINRGACTPGDTVAGALNLDSPAIMLPITGVPRVAIDHYVAVESGWDGGNVKIKVNGGAWTVIPDTAFEVNGYFAPGTLNTGGNDNPLAGEEAFTGGGEGQVATGWGQSQINLTGIAGPGDTIQLRFDMGLDGCNGVDGWYVDEVQMYVCEAETNCGNGVLDVGETCDDGNQGNGDGCSDICLIEDGWSCTDPVAGGNIVSDWSFEGSYAALPNADWTPASTFGGAPGFPLCGPDNGCPAAGLASTGDWAVWIGGIADGVTSSMTQSLTIPTTATNLTLQTLRGLCDAPGDTLHVSIDGVDIGTQVCDGTDGGFAAQTYSVAAYADDTAHTLVIGGTVGGTNGTHTNFFVDDVEISIPPAPGQCTQKLDQAITGFASTPSGGTYGGTSTLSVTGSGASGEPVTYGSSTSGVCTVTGNTVSFIAAGACTVTADQAGNASYKPAPQVTLDIDVGMVDQVITGFAANPASGTYGGTSILSVAGSGASGQPVAYGSSTSGVCTVAGNTVSFIAAGACTVTADQAGNTNYNAAPQVTLGISVGKADQTITGLASSPASGIVGSTSTLSVTGSGASGEPVTYGSSTSGVCTVAGNTVSFIAAGACTVTADQAGNTNYNAAPQVTLGISVGKADQTITGLASSPASGIVGSTSTLSVTGSGASGEPVTYGSSTSGVCTVTGDTVSFIAAGACTVTADQAGNTNYNTAPQVTIGITVGKADQAITGLASSPASGIVGSTSTLSVTGSGASGEPVTYGSSTSGVCTVTGDTVSFITAGTCTVTADQSGNTNYNAAPQVTLDIGIGKVDQTIVFDSLSNRVHGDADFSVGATASSGLDVSFSSQTSGVCSVSGGTVTLVTGGTCTLTASQAGNENYNAAATVDRSFEVQWMLGISVSGKGTVTSALAGIDCPGSCSAAFVNDSKFNLSAEHDAEWDEGGQLWDGDCAHAGTGTTCMLTMDANKQAGVEFRCGLIRIQQSAPVDTVAIPWQCNRLEAKDGFEIVGPGGYARFEAETSIELGAGFSVGEQARFRASVVPAAP